VYDDRDLHEAVVLMRVAVEVVEIPDVTWGNPAVPDKLSGTSRVSNSSSPKLLEAVLLLGDWRVLRRTGADPRRGAYTQHNIQSVNIAHSRVPPLLSETKIRTFYFFEFLLFRRPARTLCHCDCQPRCVNITT